LHPKPPETFGKDTVVAKIRNWLEGIPIGNGADRGWDDAQIVEIAEFAQDYKVDHFPAEEIYRRYVQNKVEGAEKAS